MLMRNVRLLAGKVKLITHPRCFGKTLNMDMLRHFYSVSGKEHYHEYPVLFVTFRDVKQRNWESAQMKMRDISALLMEDVLRGVERVDGVAGRMIEDILEKGNTASYEKSQELVMRMLYEERGKPV